jgi:hypothetical protein
VKGRISNLSFSLNRKQLLTIELDEDFRSRYDELKDKELTIEIKPYKPKRSLDANAYLWVLCGNIAKVACTTAEEVYRKYIRDVGKHTIVPIKNEAVEEWFNVWQRNGIGWFCEILGNSKHEGYTNIINYHGSSVYNSQEFTRLLDSVIEDCKELGIDTDTPTQKEIYKLLMQEVENG